MKALRFFIAAAAFLPLAMASQASATIDTSPGKNAVYVSGSVNLTTSDAGPLLTGSMVKGKKKNVLEITGTVRGSLTGTSNAVGLKVLVNGLTTEPSSYNFSTVTLCNASFFCSATTHVFVDLDAAEAANPGLFVGQPLTIELRGIVSIGTMSGDGSIQAHLQKK